MAKGRIRCLGSTALHLAYVALGSLIGAVTTVSKLWDIAAGMLLVEQAGGRMTDLAGQPLPPIDVETYDGRPCPILAAAAKTHPELLSYFKS